MAMLAAVGVSWEFCLWAQSGSDLPFVASVWKAPKLRASFGSLTPHYLIFFFAVRTLLRSWELRALGKAEYRMSEARGPLLGGAS
jgi:hypothetical protein